MRERVEKLEQVSGEEERAELRILYNSYVSNLSAASKDKDKKAIENLEAARKALEGRLDALEAKYLKSKDDFSDVMAAVRYLQDNGWCARSGKPVKKSTVYAAVRSNPPKLKVREDGTLAEADVLVYAAKFLKKQSGSDIDGEFDDLGMEKTREELKNQKLRNEKLLFELERERGNYLPRAQVRAELAIKLGQVDAMVLYSFRANAVDYIVATGGDINKRDLLVEMFKAEHDRYMNHLAELKEFDIVFAKEEN